jgi:hypothetical protein
MNKTPLGALALLLASQIASADVAGNWKIEGDIGGMPVSITCALEAKGATLSGVCRNDEVGDLPITGQTSADGASWTYDVNYQGQQFTVSYNGKLTSPTQLQGDIAVGGNPSGSFKGTKL